jgi:site-specific DNA recombinase
MSSKNRLGCFGARDQGRCDNHLTIRRDEVETRVLTALQDKLLRQDLFEEFCDEFTREMNRLRMEHRAGLSAAEREIERIEVRRKKLIEMVMDGVSPSEVKDELNANAARREELKARLAAAAASPPLLHPQMAELYRGKVTALAQALEHQETRTEVSEALRGLIDAIVLTPNEGELQIELKGNLAAMLGAAQNAKRSPETGDLSLQVVMVAGACNRQYRPRSTSWPHERTRSDRALRSSGWEPFFETDNSAIPEVNGRGQLSRDPDFHHWNPLTSWLRQIDALRRVG